MAIPVKKEIKLEILQLASDGKEHSISETKEIIKGKYKLSAQDLGARTPGGYVTVFHSRVAWAVKDLVEEKLLGRTKGGYFNATQLGIEGAGRKLRGSLSTDTVTKSSGHKTHDSNDELSPPELITEIYEKIRHKLAQDYNTYIFR